MIKFAIKCFLFFLSISSPAYAASFASDGSSFEICMENRRIDISNENQARIAAAYCSSKNPALPIPSNIYELPEYYEVVGTGTDNLTFQNWIRNLERTSSSIEYDDDPVYDFKTHDYKFKYYNQVELINRNDFSIFGITIGILKNGNESCSWDDITYQEIYSCNGLASSKKSGSFKCYIPRIKEREIHYCITGLKIYATYSVLKEYIADPDKQIVQVLQAADIVLAEAEQKAQAEQKALAKQKVQAERRAEAERKAEMEQKAEAERKMQAKQKALAEKKKQAEEKDWAHVEQKLLAEQKEQAEKKAQAEQERARAEQRICAEQKTEIEQEQCAQLRVQAKLNALAEKKEQAEEKERAKQRAHAEQKLLAEQKEQAEQKSEAEQRAKIEQEHARAEQKAQAEQERARAAQAAAIGREIAEYKAKIIAKIRRNIVMLPDMPYDSLAEFEVTLLPGGMVLNAVLVRPSGNAAYDSAVERAIKKAEPLPLPPDAALFNNFHELRIRFSPNGQRGQHRI